MHKKNLTYKQSGVDTSNTNNLIKYISNLSNKTKIRGSSIAGFKNIGGFGSLFDLKPYNYNNPVLVSATDGVGTKLEIANKLNQGRVENMIMYEQREKEGQVIVN